MSNYNNCSNVYHSTNNFKNNQSIEFPKYYSTNKYTIRELDSICVCCHYGSILVDGHEKIVTWSTLYLIPCTIVISPTTEDASAQVRVCLCTWVEICEYRCVVNLISSSIYL